MGVFGRYRYPNINKTSHNNFFALKPFSSFELMKMIAQGLHVFVLIIVSSLCKGGEEQYSCYKYQEQTMTKLNRMDLRLKQIEKIVNDTGHSNLHQNEVCPPYKKCPDKWIPFNGSCYLFVHRHYTYYGARSSCIAVGAHLVRIESSTENGFLKAHLMTLKDSHYWIGLTDADREGQFKWDEGDDSLPFTDWVPGQPYNYNEQDCAHFHYLYRYQWGDHKCYQLLKSICEM